MTTLEFLADLQRRQVRVWVENNNVRCRGPREVLTADLRDQLASRKMDILTLFGGGDAAPRASTVTPVRIAREGALPLSFSQERLWFLHQMTPQNAAYNIVSSVRFARTIQVDALRRSVDELVQRHEALRTVFVTRDGEPVLQILPPAATALPVIDLAGRPEDERRPELERIRAEHAGAPFDLEHGPLIRVVLVKLGDRDYELLLAVHHIVSDRWSVGVIANELQALYDRFAGGAAPPLPELPVQYVDFAAWQRQHLASGVMETQLAYWRQHLAGLSDLDLPTDRPRPSEQTYAGAWESRSLGEVGELVAAAARQNGMTPFMIMLAGFSALLHRYSAQSDIAVGTPISGRTNQLFEGVVGCFLNMLVLRTDLSGEPSFGDLLRRVRAVALDAYDHADVPFEKLVADLQPRRDTSRSPLFQVALSFQSAPKAVEMPVDVVSTASGGTLFDLTLFVTDIAGQLTLTAEYNTDLFDRVTIARMLGHLETLLRTGLQEPTRRLSDLPILTADEQRQLVAWNATSTRFDGPSSVHGVIAAQAARTPDAIAVTCGTESLTYRELDSRSTRLARHLRHLGVGAEAPVGICVDRSAGMFVGLLGILKAGAAYVPLDPAYPIERLALMLDDAGVQIVVSQSRLVDRLPSGERRVVCLDRDWAAIADHADAPLDLTAGGESLAYIIYTSGSTGRPKGVQVPHRAVVNFLSTMACAPGLSASDVLVAVTTLSFDIAGLELYLPLTVGAHVVVAAGEQVTDGGELRALLSACGATAMQATPATWRLLLEAGWSGPGVKMMCGGEALPRDLATELLDKGELWNLYGPTETTIWSCAERVGADSTVSIGRPIANTQVYVLDPNFSPVPAGVPGELYIAGDGLARGYRGRPDLTAERFVPNPFGREGDRMYRTGDLARYLPDGRLECLGRLDHQVKVRGFRIELGEVEAVLAAHDRVKEVVVVADELSPGDRRLVAYIVCRGSGSVTASDLRRFARVRLPDYMVPSFFVMLERIPLLPNGKVDRRSLPGPFQAAGGVQRTPPRTATERRIADIWQRILGVAAVSVEDNFFDIGGHSLLSMRVVAAIEQELGCRLSPRVMFLESLRQIAAQCDRQVDASAAILVGDDAAAGF